MSKTTIPTVNLDDFISGTVKNKQQFVQDLGNGFRDIGFAIVKNHGIPPKLIDEFYAASKKFFYLPKEIKETYEIPELAGQRGYTSFGKEHAKHSDVGDLKEFFQFGQEPNKVLSTDYPRNVSVLEVPELYVLGMYLYRRFETTGRYLMRAIALYLGLDEYYFDEWIMNGKTIVRSIYYPPITQAPDTAVRSEQHEDINLITLLVGASAGGLQVLPSDNEWLPVLPAKDEIAINVGDMLQRLTNNYLKSTTHRVVNPPREEWHLERLSIPCFLHPRSEMDLTCLESCVSEENPLQYEPITAGAYLDERLREIGLKK